MCGEFGEVTVIIGLVINFLAFVSLSFAFRDTSTYVLDISQWGAMDGVPDNRAAKSVGI